MYHFASPNLPDSLRARAARLGIALGPLGSGIALTALLVFLLQWLLDPTQIQGAVGPSMLQVELLRTAHEARPTNEHSPETVTPLSESKSEHAKRREDAPPAKPVELSRALQRTRPVPSHPGSTRSRQPVREAHSSLPATERTDDGRRFASKGAGEAETPAKKEPGVARQTGVSLQVVHRPAPDYPRRARRRGIEGEVLVGFTVTTLGKVESVRVIEANPRGYFEKAALDAARRFRFSPPLENGQAITITDVRNRFSFQLRN